MRQLNQLNVGSLLDLVKLLSLFIYEIVLVFSEPSLIKGHSEMELRRSLGRSAHQVRHPTGWSKLEGAESRAGLEPASLGSMRGSQRFTLFFSIVTLVYPVHNPPVANPESVYRSWLRMERTPPFVSIEGGTPLVTKNKMEKWHRIVLSDVCQKIIHP